MGPPLDLMTASHLLDMLSNRFLDSLRVFQSMPDLLQSKVAVSF